MRKKEFLSLDTKREKIKRMAFKYINKNYIKEDVRASNDDERFQIFYINQNMN